ncbi:triose-phosphate isomerase [Borrelia hermsii]|uniref:Triosephosphate isomerase n=3 Tax=Borrelia hermsii TaxID=140 RepID=TPIS_BORHD|nr:triose-phosphate isomerase [Borrelia hermsii]B2S1P0.1 RecName: Full=Triosephosphate isomerase; Short=TIM; Short=TPI; AltName: Full=Triose-phosphate isomerase [Borrelia hermsii DAH]AAX16577.1 triosephosphate isomerase [Borrelia hermsii DAH]AJW72888.1 triosephosphate isomerase [Borrelia hermsii CC1]AMR75756.1 Triosephosphate isomerase [Borrelia hermsii]ANA42877.1 triose-phosphate isomerase [Borrelia hermsii HS1]UCP01095.1 triose-phosphate isomerase [Borrelia hermsii]
MRKMFLAGNWKMHYTSVEAAGVAKQIVDGVQNINDDVVIMITPAFTSLCKVCEVTKGSNVLLGAQNMSYENSGARTSEISPSMLLEFGVDYVILGHSECRTYLGDTDEVINKKILAGLKHPFKYLILCIGETLSERENNKTLDVVLNQIRRGLMSVSESDLKRIILAYEPVWAIGTGKTATKEEAQEVHRAIRLEIESLYSTSAADDIIIQYGGSVNVDNVGGLMGENDIDGALIGGASLKADSFLNIVNKVAK